VSDKYISPPLSEEQKKILEGLTSGEYNNFAALSGRFQDQDVAYIVAVHRGAHDMSTFSLTPVAIIVDSTFMKKFGNDMLDAMDSVPTADE
jgi:hypothetical protein